MTQNMSGILNEHETNNNKRKKYCKDSETKEHCSQKKTQTDWKSWLGNLFRVISFDLILEDPTYSKTIQIG